MSPHDAAPAEAQAVRDLAAAYQQMTEQIGQIIVGLSGKLQHHSDQTRHVQRRMKTVTNHFGQVRCRFHAAFYLDIAAQIRLDDG